jgi:hypothetical protein
MAGLSIRLARSVNRVLERHGRVWGDRYHARALRTPRETRHAIVYVLMNFKKHGNSSNRIDPMSSARWFDGWRTPQPTGDPPRWANAEPPVLSAAHMAGAP